MTAPFARRLLGWKVSAKNKLGWPLVPNIADVDNAESMRIAAGMLDELAVIRDEVSGIPKDPGGSVARNANPDQQDAWREVVGQRRLLSYEVLVNTLASW